MSNVIRSKRLKVTTFLYELVNVFNIKESMNTKNETCRYHDLDNHKITIKVNNENYYKMGGSFRVIKVLRKLLTILSIHPVQKM